MTDTRHENMPEPRPRAAGHNGAFLRGLAGGALLGTAAGVLFAPQISAALGQLRRHMTDAAAGAGGAAADKYRETATRVSDAVDDLQQKGRTAYGKALSAVKRGADDVRARVTDAQAELDQRDADAQRRA